MDDLILRYYEAEMHYLREAGKEFALAHPDRAAMLNLDEGRDLDPYVERLLEGFAFLMGRMRQKLDDSLPELTEGLVSLLWPHYMRTIPSLSIVELAPDYQDLQRSESIAKGFEVVSQPVGPSQTRCYYRTTRDMCITPLHITSATLQNEPDGRSVIRLRFDCGPLPTAYLDDIAQRREGYEGVTDFLDIFNHRMMTQYYRIWRKYSYPATYHSGGKDETSQCLLGLVGLGIPGSQQQIDTPVSRFLALLGTMRLSTRTAEGVIKLVELLAPLTQAKVVPHDRRRVRLAQQEFHADLLVLLRVYLGWRCSVRLHLTLPKGILPPAQLGKQRIRLGRTGVLGLKPGAPAVSGMVTINLGHYQGLLPSYQYREAENGSYQF